MANDVLIPPDLDNTSPESVELVDSATQVFAPSMARGLTQRISFGDPYWRLTRKYSAVRAEDKARLSSMMGNARGRLATVRTVPGYVQRGSFPSQELFANPTFGNGSVGWTAESTFLVSARDKVLRSLRASSGGAAFFVLPSAPLTGLTPYAIYAARFFLYPGPILDPATMTIRIDDYGVFAGYTQFFEPMATALIVPKTSSARPGIALITPAILIAERSYIDCHWASFTQCALVDTGANLIPYSDAFDNASWAKSHCSIGVNVTTGPDGTGTADSLIEDAATGVTHVMVSPALPIPSQPVEVTATAYVKANARTWCFLGIFENTGNTFGGAYFNLSAGSIGTVVNGANMTDCRVSIRPLGSSWYRVSVTVRNTNAATTVQAQLYLATGDLGATYDGNGVSGILVWRIGCAVSSAWGIPNQTTGVADSTGTPYKASSVNVKGLPVSTQWLLAAGDYIEINGELKRVTSQVTSDQSGCSVIQFRPAMVTPPSDNDPIIIGNPMGRFTMTNPKWDSQWGLQEDATFTLDEVYE